MLTTQDILAIHAKAKNNPASLTAEERIQLDAYSLGYNHARRLLLIYASLFIIGALILGNLLPSFF